MAISPKDKAPYAPRGHSVGADWPSWRYSPDGLDKDIFKSPADVPEGWLDAPPSAPDPTVKVRPPARGAAKKPVVDAVKKAAALVDKGKMQSNGLPLSHEQITAALTQRGIAFNASAPDAALYEMYLDHIEANEA